ncbi:MAG: hypothetical protein JXJ30_09465 [Halothiobacillaceae bacterium]|nr:hypothetical protein [Halothiobacillaceae bacterium]
MTEERVADDGRQEGDGAGMCEALRRYGRAVAHEIARRGHPERVESLSPRPEVAEARLRASLECLKAAPESTSRPIRRSSLGYARRSDGIGEQADS